MEEKNGQTSMDDKSQQLFYKLANLDDRIKNADQVGLLLLLPDANLGE